jgi:GntP family gluconate:H+ symporter
MSPEALRLAAALVGIILLVVLVARFKWHPFLALMLVSWGLAVTCGIGPAQAISAFSKGFGDILSFVGIVIGLGTMIGGLLVARKVVGQLQDQSLGLFDRREKGIHMRSNYCSFLLSFMDFPLVRPNFSRRRWRISWQRVP